MTWAVLQGQLNRSVMLHFVEPVTVLSLAPLQLLWAAWVWVPVDPEALASEVKCLTCWVS